MVDKISIDGAVARAVECVQRNLDATSINQPIDVQAICNWAVGAAFRYMRGQPEPGGSPVKTKRVNEPKLSPTDLGGDPRDIAKAKGFSGNMCNTCGGMSLTRTGTCETCQDCGATSGGCS